MLGEEGEVDAYEYHSEVDFSSCGVEGVAGE